MCPKCGSDRIQVVQDTKTKGFGGMKAAAGCCIFNLPGLLCGLCGMGKSKSKTRRVCLNCGKKF